jgi:CxxC-x17-CxxC domain-containing protein
VYALSYQDKTLICVDCGAEFAFTANEQAFYADRGFTNEPKRCQACRQSRKAARGGGYSGGGYSSNGDGYGASGGFSSGGGRREMHTVQCSNCGGEARVPFVPRGDRPVYCSDCFSQQRGGGYSRAGGRY